MATSRSRSKAAATASPAGQMGSWRIRLWWLALASTLGLWAYLWWDPEVIPDLSLLQYAPFPGYLLPVVALAVWMWPLARRWWAWRWLAWVPVLVVLVPIMGLCHGWPDDGSIHLRVMTYNIKSYLMPRVPGGYSKLTAEIVQSDPDIVFMQDAHVFDGMQGTHPELFKMLMGDRTMVKYQQYVILSRFPLSHCEPGYMPYQGVVHTFFHCDTVVHGRPLSLITVHFNTPRDGLNAARADGLDGLGAWKANMSQRLFQSSYLAEYVRRAQRPCIVAGDLNAPEHSRVVQVLLDQGLRDVFSSSSWGWGYTYGHAMLHGLGLSFLRIDHILVSDDIGVESASVGNREASQHRPVIADLFLSRQ